VQRVPDCLGVEEANPDGHWQAKENRDLGLVTVLFQKWGATSGRTAMARSKSRKGTMLNVGRASQAA